MANIIKGSALAVAASLMAITGTASAATSFGTAQSTHVSNGIEEPWQNSRNDRNYRNDDNRRYNRGHDQRAYYGEPVYRNTRVWRGRDGRNYCRKKDGTVGLIVGGAVGALIGRELDGGYNRSLGTILGAAGGALLGREVARGGTRCR